jgi:predicted phosphodiesterase
MVSEGNMTTMRFCVLITIAVILIGNVGVANAAVKDLKIDNSPVRFAIIGDRTAQHVPGVYEEIVAEIEAMEPDFVMTVGDAIEGYTADTLTLKNQWDDYLSIIKPLTMPIYLTPGNHDITTDAALGMYREKAGEPYYSFNVKNYHFIVLDVSRQEASNPLPKEEFDWLIKDLQTHRDAAQTLVFYHKPFWYDTIVMGKPDTLHSLFVANGVDAVFNGHLHTYFSAKIDGILYTALGSSGGIIDAVPSDLDYHFTWVTVDDKGISIAPIKKGSVKQWDIVTASEEHVVDDIAKNNMNFTSAALVGSDLKVSDMNVNNRTAKLNLKNSSNQVFSDTLRWQIPDGWTINPSSEQISVAPGENKEIEFKVNSTGNLYPLPTVTARFPYAEKKTIPVSRDLRIAREAVAPLVARPPMRSPEIDGKIDDTFWCCSQSKLFNPNGGETAVESTYFYFVHTPEYLYIGVHCLESDMNALKADVKDHDGAVYGEDCVGFFLQPNCQIDTAYQIYFNPNGVAFDQKIYKGSLGYFEGDKSWNGEYLAKTYLGDKYWDIEIQIPFAQFGVTGDLGKSFGLNFLRKQKRLNASGDWQIPIDYDPKTFGILLLN